jgi:hypothetical protein
LRSSESEEALFRALTEVEAHYIGTNIDRTTGMERTYPVTLPWLHRMKKLLNLENLPE